MTIFVLKLGLIDQLKPPLVRGFTWLIYLVNLPSFSKRVLPWYFHSTFGLLSFVLHFTILSAQCLTIRNVDKESISGISWGHRPSSISLRFLWNVLLILYFPQPVLEYQIVIVVALPIVCPEDIIFEFVIEPKSD